MQPPVLAAVQILWDRGVNQQQLVAGSTYTLFYPGRSEQMLEIKGISSQTPIFKAQLVQMEENP